MTRDEKFMRAAIAQARLSLKSGDVPVGCVIVKNGRIIARGHNEREKKKNALCHAEITAINRACKRLGGWRLIGAEMYVTLEPCPMCAGAVINSRIERLVYGASDEKGGAVENKATLFEREYNHRPEVVTGVLGKECAALLKQFFATLREKHRKNAEITE